MAANSWAHELIDVDYSENELGERGVTFSEIGDGSCVVKMALENGSASKLMLPSGLITSYKPQMWHGGTMELLHTSVDSRGELNEVVIQGGLSLSLSFGCENIDAAEGVLWSPNEWTLHQVKGTPQESIQLQLICKEEGINVNAKVKHIITLGKDLLTSEVIVSNSSTCSSFRLTGSVLSHLAVSTPDATYAIGLQGSDYFIRPPFDGDFSIIPPDFDDKKIRTEPLEGEEDDNYKHLTEKLSMIYTSAPRNFTIIDRGRRNSVSLRRDGFNELYMLSPGSEHEWYGKYSYICVGHAALLEPIIVDPQSQWRGRLQLFNPNY
ncbi:hypothetical protein RD792_001342 [Penstemon davidsonii]|uniref:Uncharacterized protein n=1 Tax=Penstemon davidsonii TaxID=160366 RepID=A0ABR0DN61_9LAMI|nr:hypothetical protein RD792_001342 [Penstemon davidsonii]